jgi:hypothetical protein
MPDCIFQTLIFCLQLYEIDPLIQEGLVKEIKEDEKVKKVRVVMGHCLLSYFIVQSDIKSTSRMQCLQYRPYQRFHFLYFNAVKFGTSWFETENLQFFPPKSHLVAG